MGLARDILDAVFHPDRDRHEIPSLDGGFAPNERLEAARTHAVFSAPAAMARGPGGEVYVAEGEAIRVSADPELGDWRGFATLPAAAGALACDAEGGVIAAVEGAGLVRLSPQGRTVAELQAAEGERLGCVTALAVAADGTVLIADGSRRNPAGAWLHDLMRNHPGDGRILACGPDLRGARVLADGLRWPAGVAEAPEGGGILFTEAWAHRLSTMAPDGGGRRVLAPNFAGYPTRLSPSPTGGVWVAFLGLRTQLIEFVLREDAFRTRMMMEVPPELWIGPSFGGGFDYREPTQVGRIKKLGIQKPWAPARSYGLAARLDAEGAAVESLHSRAAGSLHGLVDVFEAEGRLFALSRGHGRLASAALDGEGD